MLKAKDKLIQTAFELFCYEGFNKTGIDTIVEKAGVNKMTMYYHFKNKEDLILASLEYTHNIFIEGFLKKLEKSKISPEKKVIKIFQKLWKSSKEKDAVRCIFINATAEFPDINHKIHKAAIKHKKSMENFVRKMLKEAGYKNARYLSRMVTILSQGSLVMAQISDDKRYYLDAKETIESLLKTSKQEA